MTITYPTTPDTSIRKGDRVRSFDFLTVPEYYVDGTVVDFVDLGDCQRYEIKVDRRVAGGVEAPVIKSRVFPPVNGTPGFIGGVCRGVAKL